MTPDAGRTEWRDADGKALTDYPRPSVAVDVAVLTVQTGQLHVLVVERPDGALALPGSFLRPGERLADAAERALQTKAGLVGADFHQLAMFDAPDRDGRGWVLSMAHGATLRRDELPAEATLVRVDGRTVTAPLAFDHAAMVSRAVDDLRGRYARRVDPSGLLTNVFTVLELRRLYETVFGRSLPKDSFRRLVIDAIEATGRTSSSGTGRPAELFRHRSGADLPAGAAGMLTD
ncbi:NUDIX hydrolase [Rhodococcus spongiicola]|uniref:NUDIX domain-containing protein n=1 Tax=Rhodococcus spongiicola TaxID=2487352 RepID=A0A3S3CUM8_9NOCA|nr:NUDIX domain-containing protein [Rhodococcus spongiicola]RVW06017.1 NUDIX domain-containing protein [Rhodococcus spongiicola]